MTLFGIVRSTPFVALCTLAVLVVSPWACSWLVSPLLPMTALRATRLPDAPEESDLAAKLAAAQQELAELRGLLRDFRSQGVSTDSPGPSILSRVLGADPTLLSSSLILDRGSSQGVSEDAVAVSSGCLLGFVSETSAQWSLLEPLDSPTQRWVVDIVPVDGRQPPSEGWPRGVGSGRLLPGGGRSVEVWHISAKRAAEIKVGDAVVTTGTDFRCPKGLLAGHVADVRREDLFLRITLTPARDVSSLPVVLLQPPPAHPFRRPLKRR